MHVKKPEEKILVIGANVAGLALCKALATKGLRATVIDPKPDFEWFPNMHEIISSEKNISLLSFRKENLLTKLNHEYIPLCLEEIDYDLKQVKLSDSRVLAFDKLVIAMGGVNQSYGVKSVDKFARTFKSLADAEMIRKDFFNLMNRKSIDKHENIVIVGGGVEGVEVLGEILKCNPKHKNIKVHLINSHSRLFHEFSPLINNRVTQSAKDSVNFYNNVKVVRLSKDNVYLSNGEKISAKLIIWTGGVCPSKKLLELGLTHSADEWIPVDRSLRHTRYKDIYAIGDCVSFRGLKSKQAYYAIEMGQLVAENLSLASSHKKLKNFVPSSKPMVVTFGDKDAFLISGKTCIASTGLLALKELVYQLGMIEMEQVTGLQSIIHSMDRLSHLLSIKTINKFARLNINAIFNTSVSFG